MNMYIDGQGWGEAIRENIWAVLESVDRVFRPCFGSSMNTNDLLVITEVKSRSTDDFGKGFDAMDLKKRAHLIRGAKAIKQDRRFESMQVRFDVASVDGGKLEYIENAI